MTPLIKLFAIALVAWIGFGGVVNGAQGGWLVAGLFLLVALLDASWGRLGEGETLRRGDSETLRGGDGEMGRRAVALLRGVASLSVWPFYGALALLAGVALNGRTNRAESASLAASRGWPVADSAAANHAPGAAGRCACGKPLGHDKTYDAVGRLSEIRHVAPDKTVLFSETSRYDDRNRRTARIHEDNTTDLFAYDPAGQVTAAAYGQAQSVAAVPAAPKTENSEPRTANASVSFKPSQTFAYDPAGNRQSFQDLDGSKTEYTANEANQYTSVSQSVKSAQSVDEPRYDKLGNLLIDDTHSYTWDADIHLLIVTTQPKVAANDPLFANRTPTTESFRYDALHRRVARHESATNVTTLFIMDGWNVISEYQPLSDLKSPVTNPNQSLRLVWGEDLSGTLQGAGGIGGLLSTVNGEARTWNGFHFDSNGNAIRLSDAIGNESARYQYDAFGKTILAQGAEAMNNRYQFSTKPIELSSGLAFYGYRYYAPELGRWPSRDPIGERGGINLYGMVHNDIANSWDHLGLLADALPPEWVTDPDCVAACILENSPMLIGSIVVGLIAGTRHPIAGILCLAAVIVTVDTIAECIENCPQKQNAPDPFS